MKHPEHVKRSKTQASGQGDTLPDIVSGFVQSILPKNAEEFWVRTSACCAILGTALLVLGFAHDEAKKAEAKAEIDKLSSKISHAWDGPREDTGGVNIPLGRYIVAEYVDRDLNRIDVCYGKSTKEISPYKMGSKYPVNLRYNPYDTAARELVAYEYPSLEQAKAVATEEFGSLRYKPWSKDIPNQELYNDPSFCARYQDDQLRQ